MARMIWSPREYQPIAVDWLIDHPRSALWAGMGLGKTVSTLTAIDRLFLTELTSPALIVAPLRVARKTWPDESMKWEHLRNIELTPIVGNTTDRHRTLFTGLKTSYTSVFSINYDNLVWLAETLKSAGVKWPFKLVVLDESTRVKSYRGSNLVSKTGVEFTRVSTGVRAGALARHAHRSIDYLWELTGTPAPNGLKDLWAQMWFLDGGRRLGTTYESFKQRWFQKSYNGYGIEPLPHADAQIHEMIKDVCLTLDAKDYFDLNAPIETMIEVDLPPSAARLYKQMEKEMFLSIQGHDVEAFSAASKTIKCLQLAAGAVYVDAEGTYKEVHNATIEALDEIVEEANGMPVLVVYHFKSDLARLKKAFPKGREYRNEADEDDWNAGKIPVMFIHPQSGGHGVNLQDGGNILVIFTPWWNLEEYLQVIERIGPVRQMQAGYDRPVFIYHIVVKNTIYEAVIESRLEKSDVQECLLNYMKRKSL